MKDKIKAFKSKWSQMNEQEKDEYLEKAVIRWALWFIFIVLALLTLAILYANFYPEKRQKVEEKTESTLSKEVLVNEGYKKIRFSADYEDVSDLITEEKEEDLALNYVIGEDMLAVARTISNYEGNEQVKKAFVSWATIIQNAQSSFSYNQGSQVVSAFNNYAPKLEDELLYRTLYGEMASRSILILDSINDLQHFPNNEIYYNRLYSNLIQYERSGNPKYLDVMEKAINDKPKSSVDYDVTDKWLAKIEELRYANSYWEDDWSKTDES